MWQRKIGRRAAALLALVVLFGGGEARPSPAHLAVRGASDFATVMVTATDAYYFCRVTQTDGTVNVRSVYSKNIDDLKKTQKDEYKDAVKEWEGLRAKWMKAKVQASFPVPKPVSPKVQRLAKVPDEDGQRNRAFDRHKDKLEVWNVCVIKDMKDQLSAKAIRRDKMHLEQVKLLTEYAEAVIEWLNARNEAPDADKGEAPKKPVITVRKSDVRKADTAEALANKLDATLKARETKKEE
ncbi:MAG: hypothetical protein ABIF82_11665 [Planctomycetota bacterium]